MPPNFRKIGGSTNGCNNGKYEKENTKRKQDQRPDVYAYYFHNRNINFDMNCWSTETAKMIADN
ncbi:hypothetical protein BH10ACI3_BH10ACI3_11890 [soil metagenome]